MASYLDSGVAEGAALAVDGRSRARIKADKHQYAQATGPTEGDFGRVDTSE